MKRMFVTDGAAFIGSTMVEAPIHKGSDITVFGNFVSRKKQNITHLLKNPRLKFVEDDILENYITKETVTLTAQGIISTIQNERIAPRQHLRFGQ